TCLKMCGDREHARDLTQEVFLKALEQIGRFRGESAFYTWVYRVAVNLTLSKLRKDGVRRAVSLDSAPDPGVSDADPLARRVRDLRAVDAAASAQEADRRQCVVRALHALEDEYRAVVVLRDIEGLDYQQIAAILEVPVGTVKSRLHRARMSLRATLLPLMEQAQGDDRAGAG
ncbi:MAG: RNA polymerase sigma factor, partial [Phycisphaerae bacterium]